MALKNNHFIYFNIVVLLCCLSPSLAQKNIKNTQSLSNDARFVVRPLIFIQYNLYQHYQHTKTENMGQVFNLVPGIGTGLIIGKKTSFLMLIEASVQYHPFSIDLQGYEGLGSLSFPLLVSFRLPLRGFFFAQIGGGIQFNHINVHLKQHNSSFFSTYTGEVALGVEENLFLLFFFRFGYNQWQQHSIDFGFRLGLNGNLWE